MSTWLKSLPWIVTLGAIGAAILFVMNGRKASKLLARAKTAEDQADILINSNISKQIDKGHKLTEKANVHKDNALKAKERMHDRLEQLGNADENISTVASRFNSGRVRLKPGGAT